MHEHCKIMQRPDGRWVIVYGSETVKDGKEAKDAGDYGTAEEAVAARGVRGPATRRSGWGGAREAGHASGPRRRLTRG